MFAGNSARRDFLKLGGAGVVGAALRQNSSAEDVTTAAANCLCKEFNVRAFGAKGDGHTIDTAPINRAIDAAAVDGGTVIFPAGSYLSYSIRLKNNIALYLGPGAMIVAADSTSGGNGYDPPEPNQWDKYQDFGHSHWHNSLIWGEGLSNVSIFGPGVIWGRGLSRGERDAVLPAGVGNKAISLKNSRNVTFRDFSILHGGHFAILATGVDNLTIDNLTVDTNRDALDVDCCRNVRISNCSINSPWDDGICLKSSYGLGVARATDNVTIANCYVTGGFEEGTLLSATYKRIGPEYKAPRNGRIKFGTESNGGFRNITVTNCVIENCRGIALETVDGGLLEDVAISNIAMREITDVPFFLRLGSRMRGPEGAAIGQLRRVSIENVVVSNADSRQATIISGIPGHEIEDVRFNGIYIFHRGGGTGQDAELNVPELENAYPDPNRFGTIPAQGFFIRHVNGLIMRDVQIRSEKQDLRPGFILEDVQGADFSHIKLPAGALSGWRLKSVNNFAVENSRPVADTYLETVTEKTL